MVRKPYSKSEKARKALIKAAGALISEYGSASCVSVREIAKRAGISPSMIKYYFGDKDGLVSAVMSYVVDSRCQAPIRIYLDRNRELLNTPDGRIIFINGMVDEFCEFFTNLTDDCWRNSMIYRFLQRSEPRLRTGDQCYYLRDMLAFYEIYETLTGDKDLDRAYGWFSVVFVPLALRFTRGERLYVIGEGAVLSDCYDKRFVYFCKNLLLTGLKLMPPGGFGGELPGVPSGAVGDASGR